MTLFDDLFGTLRKGGRFGPERLPYINGGLFDEQPALSFDGVDVQLLIEAGRQDWAHIDPSIFGTLFERLLDPDKRAQIGAHYIDAEEITRIIEPVLLRPLRAMAAAYGWPEDIPTEDALVRLVALNKSRTVAP